MRYNPELNYRKRNRFLFKVRIFFLVLALFVVAVGSYYYYSIVSQQHNNTEASSTSEETKAYYASSVKVFRSPFFQMQLDQSWAEVPSESNASKFVYRSLRANLIEHQMVIYVNDIPETLSPNRILPVNLKGDSEFLPITVSKHCIDAAGGSRIDSPVVTLERVKFRCDADSTDYRVMIGQIEGTTVLKLKRPDGTTANYSIYYSNLKATPDDSPLIQVAESFQTR